MWDGAVVAAKYLEAAAASLRPQLTPPYVLELGSGTGLAGLAAAMALQLPTCLTDLPEVLPSLEANVASNPGVAELVSVAALDWTQQPADPASLGGPPGLIVAADCVWLEPLVQPFVACLASVAGPTSRVLMAHQSRSNRVDSLLFGLLGEAFETEPVPRLDGEPDRGRIELLWLRTKRGEDLG